MSDETKRELLGEGNASKASKGGPIKEEADDDLDAEALQQAKMKLKQLKHATAESGGDVAVESESKEWQDLPTTKAFMTALGSPKSMRFEEASEDAKKAVIDRWDNLRQGEKGFNAKAAELMKQDGVPYNTETTAPLPGEPSVQPYQETVSWLVHPLSIPNPRLLVVHRTGAGKTCSMIRICDNFFKDKRPKIAIFPVSLTCM